MSVKYEIKTLDEITLIVPENGGDAICRVYKAEFAQAIADALTAASFVAAHPIECE